MKALPRLLLVDDEPSITDSLAPFLSRSGFDVAVAVDGQDALQQFAVRRPDVVISDVMMPRLDGRELVRRLRGGDDWTPIILLTKVGESFERSAALEEGADDYLNKPFDPQELVSRVRAVLRRVAGGQAQLVTAQQLCAGELRLDRTARRVWLGERELILTPKAMHVLEYLMARPGEAHSRERLLQALWGYTFAANTRAIDHRIAELRKVIGDDPQSPRFIHTVPGFGYRFAHTVTQ
ncbi:DNA-binding response regulator [Pseudoclavibacter sp. AY1F1]|nr:DNA-binding response regulator [Pseudoclavibacter sp. AY1F1]